MGRASRRLPSRFVSKKFNSIDISECLEKINCLITFNLVLIVNVNRKMYFFSSLKNVRKFQFKIITTRERVVCSSPRRGFTCSPPKGGIEYLTLHYYYCCHLPVALSTYFSFLNGSIYSSIPI